MVHVFPVSRSISRLKFRFPRDSDVAAIFQYASDPEVTHFMDWTTLRDAEEARQFVLDSARPWASGEEHTWVVTGSDNDAVIGATSCRIKESSADFGYVLNLN